jgi:membrane protease subunit HflK
MSEHHHHHPNSKCCSGHGPQPDGPAQEPLDAAGQSLTRALQVSFSILKLIMIVLLVLFLCSGIFQVQQDEKALLLRFGRIVGSAENPVIEPGIRFAFPEPINEVIRIPVTREQSLSIDGFWYFETEREKLNPTPASQITGPLDPVTDGYTLTRNDKVEGISGTDYNIVHSKWTLKYKIGSPRHFFENVYIADRKPGQDLLEAAAPTLEPLLESLASDAIVSTMVRYSIDEAIKNEIGIAEKVKFLLQEKLNEMQSGITVSDVRASRIIWPRQVEEAFQASTKARQESEQVRIDAWSYKEKMLTDTGGPGAEAILEKLKQPGLSQEEQELLVAQLSGQVQSKISEARAYRTTVVNNAKANAEYLLALLPEYRNYPELVLQKLYQDAVEQVLANAEEKILIQPSADGQSRELRVMISRDPNIKKEQAKKQASGR